MRYIRLSAVLLLLACGDGGSSPTSPPTPPTPPAPVATSITLSATSLSFASLGETSQLTATVKDQNGATMSGASVTWSSSSASVATVSSSGLVTAVANGTATITATSGSASANANASIQQVAVSITLSPDSLVFAAAGDTATVTATVLDAGGSEIPAGSLTWSSSDTTTVTVSSVGVVTAVASGPAATVTAKTGDQEAEINARVKGSYLLVTVTGDGDPLPDVSVWLTDATGENTKQVTDSAGKTLFRNLQSGEHTVKLLPTPIGLIVTNPQTVQVGEEEGHDLVFAGTFPPAQLTGTAKSWGNPVEGALVHIEGKDTVEVTVNSAGVFQVDSVLRGEYTLTISNHTGIRFKETTLTQTLESGENTTGFLGKPDPEPFWSSILTGDDKTCGLTSEAVAYCWGRNDYGGLGNGTTTDTSWPTAVSGGLDFTSISNGLRHTCGLTTDGEAYCWGQNDLGQLGNGETSNPSLVPTLVSGGHAWASFSGAGQHTCGVTTDGEAYCWGSHPPWSVSEPSLAPAKVGGDLKWKSITAARHNICALTDEGLPVGEAYCWGKNHYGQLGDGTTTERQTATPVSGGLAFTSINSGWDSDSTCGLTSEGVAHCWGRNLAQSLGHGTEQFYTTPVTVSGDHKWVWISPGDIHSCGVTSTGSGYCWGHMGYGRLGNGTNYQSITFTPQLISGGLTFSSISPGRWHSCGVTTDGEAYCWGQSSFGALGTGPQAIVDAYNYLVPQKVGGNW